MNLREKLLKFVNEAVCPVGDGEQCQHGFVSGAYWGWGEARNQIGRIIKQYQPTPNDAISVYRDGNAFCAVQSDFINLQESAAGFGATASDAVRDLLGEPQLAPVCEQLLDRLVEETQNRKYQSPATQRAIKNGMAAVTNQKTETIALLSQAFDRLS